MQLPILQSSYLTHAQEDIDMRLSTTLVILLAFAPATHAGLPILESSA